MHNYQMWLTCSSELRDLQFADWFSLVVAGIQAQQVCLPLYLAHLALALISRLSLTRGAHVSHFLRLLSVHVLTTLLFSQGALSDAAKISAKKYTAKISAKTYAAKISAKRYAA